MNVKLISKALHTLSLLSDEDYDLVLKFRALTEDERGLLITVLEPEKPATKKASKSEPRKIQHCAVCNWTKRAALHKDTARSDYHEFVSSELQKSNGKPVSKSPRATNLHTQLKSRVSEGREVVTRDATGEGASGNGIVICGASLASSGLNCNLPQGHALHADKGYVDYHPFQPAASTATTLSPANGGAGSSND